MNNTKITNKNKTRKSKNGFLNYNKMFEELFLETLKGTKTKNIDLFMNIHKTNLHNDYIQNKVNTSGMTNKQFSKNISFLVLTYQNNKVYSILSKLSGIDMNELKNQINEILEPFFTEAEIIGGGNDKIVVKKKSSSKTTTNYIKLNFFISVLTMIFTLFCVNSSILQIKEEMDKNTAFSLIQQIDDTVLSCNLSTIRLSKEEKSFFKMAKHISSSNSFVVNIEKIYKMSKCINDPSNDLVSDLVMKNPPEFQPEQQSQPQQLLLEMDKNVMALVPSSVNLLIPTDTMVQYVKKYNTEIYDNVHTQLTTDLTNVKSWSEMDKYLEKIKDMDVERFKQHFFSAVEEETVVDTVIPNLTDVYNILNTAFGMELNTEKMFKLSLSAYSGRSIMNILYTDFQQKIREMKKDLEIKKINAEFYVETMTLKNYSNSCFAFITCF